MSRVERTSSIKPPAFFISLSLSLSLSFLSFSFQTIINLSRNLCNTLIIFFLSVSLFLSFIYIFFILFLIVVFFALSLVFYTYSIYIIPLYHFVSMSMLCLVISFDEQRLMNEKEMDMSTAN